MILLVDIGNTRLKWACLIDGHLQDYGSTDYCGSEFPPINGWKLEDSPEAVYFASVADPGIDISLMRQVSDYWGCEATRLESASSCCGVVNGYHDPGQLGVDRWAAMIAARTLWNTPLCVIDCGSAVTVDSIDANGQHLGGYIVPGLRMQRSLLQEETARVSVAEQARTPSGWGKETSECVSRGVEEALAGLVERSVRQLALELNAEVTTVITGGDGAVIMPLFECEAHYEEHLVLHGMARMVRERKD